MLIAIVKLTLGKPKTTRVKVLFDSGATGSVIFWSLTAKLRVHNNEPHEFDTAAGLFQTKGTSKVQFRLPEFFDDRIIEHRFHITNQKSNYDIIIGQDLLSQLKIDIKFSTMSINWDDAVVPMKPDHWGMEDLNPIIDSATIEEATSQIKQITDAKYKKANLEDIAKSCTRSFN